MVCTRRGILGALAAGASGTVAGCLDGSDGSSSGVPATSDAPETTETTETATETTEDGILVDLGVPCTDDGGDTDVSGGRPAIEFERAVATPKIEYADGEIPLRDSSLYLGHDRSTLADRELSGGVGLDGIPSIDEPKFVHGDEAELPACERILGVELDGDVRAYPQRVLVYHEIVNDVVGGEPVSVTYCPLTGTAQGFYRGGGEFGVSGRLVNSNLIMWDRHRDLRWSQIAATAIDVGGQRDSPDADRLLGRSLREFRVIWTTWGRWRERYPDTLVMTDETGSARNYNREPYGSYGPPVTGHYALGTGRQPNFPLLAHDEADAKQVVVGARTADGAVAFDKRTLIESRVRSGSIGETPIVAVADRDLASGYVYANPDGLEVTADSSDAGYEVEGEIAPAADLPLESILAFDAMWFAWYAFYPDTERVGI